MKKLILILSVVFVVGGSLTSCCKTCTKPGENNVTLCKDNYSTQAEYDDAVALYTIVGYDCK